MTSSRRAATRRRQQQHATERFGFPLYTDTVVVARDADGLPPGTQERTARAAQAVRDHRDARPARTCARCCRSATRPDRRLPRAARPRPRSPTCTSTTRRTSTSARDDRPSATRQRYLGGAREAVVGATGAAPARLAQYEEIQDALPLVEAASVALILLIVGLAFRSLGAPLVTLFTAAIAYLIAIRVLPWLGERSGATRAGRGRADHRRAAARPGHGLLGVLPVRDAPAAAPRARRGSTPSRAATAPHGADRAHRRSDRRGRHRRAGRRQARVLPRLRARAGGHDADRAAGLDDARARRCWRCSARACSAARQAAAAATGRSRTRSRTRSEIERARQRGAPGHPGPPERAARGSR